MHLARAATGRIGLPARRTGLGHQVVQRFSFAVEHCARLLASQHDQLKRVHEHLVELAAALAEADREQRGQRIFRRLHLFDRSGAQLQAGIESGGNSAFTTGKKPMLRAVTICVWGWVRKSINAIAWS
jgi:hypothetical protein